MSKQTERKQPYDAPQVTSVNAKQVHEALGPAVASVYQDPLTGLGD